MYEIFEALLKQRGVSAAEVCRETGILPSTISNWKKRGHVLSTPLLEKIADYFRVSVDYLLTGTDTVHKSVEGNEYYFSDETARIAQELFENKGRRVLFDASEGLSEDDLRKFASMMEAYKDAER